ncbi:MAG: ABC transporter ATP-binding protein [Deltaproteobacteria bacterium]|nr:MAG: ABC transporter ATP-binding protein [Deltaproteobacteria bacterium]
MSAEALRLEGLSKSFGGVPAVRGVSLAIADGERRLLLGPNGAGKTTLFNLVTGDLPPDTGSIRLFGREISRMAAHRRVHLGLARTYQVITLFPRDTLAHNLELALLGLSPLRWNPVALLSRRPELRERALAVLDRLGLRAAADRRLSDTSYGEQRRVEIAMALSQEPRVLLLDEPFAGLSQEERRDIQQQLAAIPRRVTVVMIEHDLDVALSFAERITVLHQGEIIVEGSRAEVVADARVQEVYLGT